MENEKKESPKRSPRKSRAKAEPVVEETPAEPTPRIHINAPFAFVQASQSLQVAEQWALNAHDYQALIDAANSWIEMGRHLLDNGVDLVYDEDAGTVAQEDITDQPIGFQIGFGGSNDPATEGKPETDG